MHDTLTIALANQTTSATPPTIGRELVPAVQTVVSDNTEHNSSEQRITALTEAVPDGLIIVNDLGLIVCVNRQTEALFGYDRSELLDQPIELLLPGRHRHSHVGRRDAFINSPHTRPMGVGLELAGQHKNGHEIPVEVSLGPLPSVSSIEIICSIRDISARKAAEAERSRLQDEVIQAQRATLWELSTPLIPLPTFDRVIQLLIQFSTYQLPLYRWLQQ